MKKFSVMRSSLFLLILTCQLLIAQSLISIDTQKKLTQISPLMVGVFFEDINFGADGGLYAELTKNRSFEFDRPLRGWQILKNENTVGRIQSIRDESHPRNPRYVRILCSSEGNGFGLSNEGFRGMGIHGGEKYHFSCHIRGRDGDIGSLTIELADSTGNIIATSEVSGFTSDWEKYSCQLVASETVAKAKLNIWFHGTGSLDLDMVSLFPENTWKGRKMGLRADLVQLLADLKPGFLRFPGGCIVEGFDLSNRYQWKNTIGPVEERVWDINRWNREFKHRLTTDYFQSFGLGFYEYFLLAEDLGAEPMPILNCGMACQFNSAELTPLEDLDPYIQDALDLVEFANGSVNTKWGAVRKEMGHPEPFHLKMLGVGNEQWGPQYVERFKLFAKALKDKYPEIKLIAATGSDETITPDGETEVAYLRSEWQKLMPDIIDEHFYRKPEWFLENVDYYDTYPRTGSELFVGEYAAQSVHTGSPDNRNTWYSALSEAAFLIGLERNADLVTMTCYAPLFAHEEAWQWRPDLIWFDNLKSYGTANYYVQKLFSLNRGTHLLETRLLSTTERAGSQKKLHASAALGESTGDIIVKVVNVSKRVQSVEFNLEGLFKSGKAMLTTLSSANLSDENSIDDPEKIYPEKSSMDFCENFACDLAPISFTIFRIPIQ